MTPDAEERIRQIEEVLEEDPVDLATGSSVDSIRSSSGPGLARLPYLTINDILALRDAGITEFEEIEANVLDLPDTAWDHVLDMVRARIIQVKPSELEAELEG